MYELQFAFWDKMNCVQCDKTKDTKIEANS